MTERDETSEEEAEREAFDRKREAQQEAREQKFIEDVLKLNLGVSYDPEPIHIHPVSKIADALSHEDQRKLLAWSMVMPISGVFKRDGKILTYGDLKFPPPPIVETLMERAKKEILG